MISPKTMRIMPFVLLAVAVTSTVVCVVVPRQRAIGKMRVELEKRRQYLQRSQQVETAIANLENELKTACDYVHQRAGKGATEAELVSVFGEITDAASRAGVHTQRFVPEPTDHSPAAIRRLTATLEAEGDFPGLFDFLARIEQLPIPLWIDDFQLRLAEDDTDRLTCEMKLVIFADNRGNSD